MPQGQEHDQGIAKACATVQATFPLGGYLDKIWEKEVAHLVNAVLRNVPQDLEHPVLMDIGCGPMDKTAVFKTLGFECWALDDLSDPWVHRVGAVDKIQEFAARMGIRFHLGRFEEAPQIPRGSFDVVTMLAVIEHLHESPRMLLNLAGELLRPGGVLCITMPNSVNLRKRVAVLTGRTNYPNIEQFFYSPGLWRGHVREYTLDETRWICEAAGFHVVASSTFEALAYARLPKWLVPAFLFVGSCFPTMRSGLCIVAQKPAGWSNVPENPAKYREAVRKIVPMFDPRQVS
jgi:2-polyprenyl-3-methyl-5-hydroxy-6-metoxy-1,4-benzoquinol methylase